MPRHPSLLPAAAVLAAAALVSAPSPGAAQGAPLTVEARVGGVLPQGAFADGAGVGEGAAAGPVFGVEVTLLSSGWRGLYAGFSQARFGCDDAGCPTGEPYVATGVNVGLRISLLPGRRVIPWIGGGALTTRVESPGVRGDVRGISSLGYGGEVGVGLWLRTAGSLALTPSLRYARATTELPGGTSLTLRYLVADLGFALTF
ncbi:MAG: hypothetical protein AMXMBFR53_37120 [Gemmatimonadota bacterium]